MFCHARRMSPSFACEGGPGWEAVSRPGEAMPGCTAAGPLPASPASGRGDFLRPACRSASFLSRPAPCLPPSLGQGRACPGPANRGRGGRPSLVPAGRCRVARPLALSRKRERGFPARCMPFPHRVPSLFIVMPGLVPGIQSCLRDGPDGDARNKSGHDGWGRPGMTALRAASRFIAGIPGRLRNVMGCHDRHALGAYPVLLSGMRPPFGAGVADIQSGLASLA